MASRIYRSSRPMSIYWTWHGKISILRCSDPRPPRATEAWVQIQKSVTPQKVRGDIERRLSHAYNMAVKRLCSVRCKRDCSFIRLQTCGCTGEVDRIIQACIHEDMVTWPEGQGVIECSFINDKGNSCSSPREISICGPRGDMTHHSF